MKYELPESLKTHVFCYEKVRDIASYRRCKKRCPNTYRECWERHLREDLFRDCAIENEMSVAGRVRCSACGAICDIHFPSNRFMCCECDHMEYCDAEDQKQILGDDYLEIASRDFYGGHGAGKYLEKIA